METATLTGAHAHARKASLETSKSKFTAAATEHECAAGEFAKAAECTNDAEALRILKLLEEHHRRLADIIKTRDVISKQPSEVGELLSETSEKVEHRTTSPPSAPTDASNRTQRASSSALSKMNQQRRDTSPALAKDIASRRGIPQPQPQPQPRRIPPPITEAKTTSAHSSHTATHRHKHSSKHREIVEAPSAASAAQLPQQTANPAEDAFSRFYSNLTSGPFSKISSMLAFAAMPLTETPSQPSSPTSSRTEKTSVRAHNGPDVKSLISPAALNALEDHQRKQGGSSHGFGPAESFYVVPTSGGTNSYANIARMDQRYTRRQHGQLTNINEDDAEFVDARETQNAKSTGSASASYAKAGSIPSDHTMEELQLQNESLKQSLDHVSRRLQAFERSAQDASMAALTQSMASVRTQGGGKDGDSGLGDRERMMEDELRKAVQEISKLKGVNQKYKSYLDRLKDSAREKERVKKERESGA
ncbi:hypothetical protein BDV97DRAFT_62437 [Delphinella strobiligena]|nr:hypothetical protein BDV97DRAFT_62437 [Delphinella strobiligena]